MRRQRIHSTWHTAGRQLLFFGSLDGRVDSRGRVLHRVCGSRSGRSIVHSRARLDRTLTHRSLWTLLVCGDRGSILCYPLVATDAILLPHGIGKLDRLGILLLELYLAILQPLPLLRWQRLVLLQGLVNGLGRAAGIFHLPQSPCILCLDFLQPLRLVLNVGGRLELDLVEVAHDMGR